jgi:hypothetical protein
MKAEARFRPLKIPQALSTGERSLRQRPNLGTACQARYLKMPSVVLMQRYLTGALWGRPVSILTETTAAIASPTGNLTVYRRFNTPALGPPEVRATPLCVPIGGI